MSVKVEVLNEEEVRVISDMLEKHDDEKIKVRLTGEIRLGIKIGGNLIAGIDACMTTFKILYISSLFVDPKYRNKGYGSMLLGEVEKKAKQLGANMIRLDTFDFQSPVFYKKLGYQEVGHYTNNVDGFEEFFFVKRI